MSARCISRLALVLGLVAGGLAAPAAAGAAELESVPLAPGPSSSEAHLRSLQASSSGAIYFSNESGAIEWYAIAGSADPVPTRLGGPSATEPQTLHGDLITAAAGAPRTYAYRTLDGSRTGTITVPASDVPRARTARGILATQGTSADGDPVLREHLADGTTVVLGEWPTNINTFDLQIPGNLVADGAGFAFVSEDSVYYVEYETNPGSPRRIGTGTAPLSLAADDVGFVERAATGAQLVRVDRTTFARTARPVGEDVRQIAVTPTTTTWTEGSSTAEYLRLLAAPAAGGAARLVTGDVQRTGLAGAGNRVLFVAGRTVSDSGLYALGSAGGVPALVHLAGARAATGRPLALHAGRVAYTDDRDPRRSVRLRGYKDAAGELSVGAPSTVSVRDALPTEVGLSGQRLAVVVPTPGRANSVDLRLQGPGAATRVLDQVPDRGFRDDIRGVAVSGTRVLWETNAGWRLYDAATGSTRGLPTAQPGGRYRYALWGPYLLRGTVLGDSFAGRPLHRIDLRTPDAPPLLIAPEVYDSPTLAGDWAAYWAAGTTGDIDLVVHNLRTGVKRIARTTGCPNPPCGAGKPTLSETALLASSTELHRLADGSTVSIPFTFRGGQLHDRHLARVDEHEAPVLSRLPFEVHAAPRYLGGVVPAGFDPRAATNNGWRPEFDLTKELGTCAVTLTRRGTTWRTLPCSTSKGVATPVWDGRDDDGTLVPAGAYRWTLSGTAADGDGAALSPEGRSPAATGLVGVGTRTGVSLTASPTTVDRGSATTTTGRLYISGTPTGIGGQRVQVSVRNTDAKVWVPVATATTRPDGTYRATVTLTRSKEVQTTYTGTETRIGSTSPTRTVRVR